MKIVLRVAFSYKRKGRGTRATSRGRGQKAFPSACPGALPAPLVPAAGLPSGRTFEFVVFASQTVIRTHLGTFWAKNNNSFIFTKMHVDTPLRYVPRNTLSLILIQKFTFFKFWPNICKIGQILLTIKWASECRTCTYLLSSELQEILDSAIRHLTWCNDRPICHLLSLTNCTILMMPGRDFRYPTLSIIFGRFAGKARRSASLDEW